LVAGVRRHRLARAELRHALRKYDDSRVAGELDAEHAANMRAAPWFTGRVFDAIGTRRILCFNGSFFGVRQSVWDRLGGFDETRYPGHWADDFFAYAVLDQGLDVANIPAAYRCGARPEEFAALTDLGWQGRHDPYKGRTASTGQSRARCRGSRRASWRSWNCSSAVSTPIRRSAWRATCRGRLGAAGQSRRSMRTRALLLATRDAYRPELKQRLSAGGTLVVFDFAGGDAALQPSGSLGVYRHDLERVAFVRART
jgi:hypothetical protein